MSMFKIQMASYVDDMAPDGVEMTKLPYPFVCDEQGFLKYKLGGAVRVIGFQKDLFNQRIDLWWYDLNPARLEQAVGMYVVTADSGGTWHSWTTAVDHMEVV